MKRDLDEVIDKIRGGLSCLDQDSIFSSISSGYTEIEKACVDYLKVMGYSVHPPYIFPNKIKKLDDLRTLFYNLYIRKFPEKIAYVKDESTERKTATQFVKARMEASNTDKNTAMQECGEIIKTVFENLDEFNFTIPITFGIFGQKSMAWVTNTAVGIMNKKITLYEQEKYEKRSEEIIRERAKHTRPGWTDEQLDRAIKNMEGKNG